MKIKFKDLNNQILSNIEVTFIVNNNPEIYITDNKGITDFFEATEGENVVCYVHEKEKHEFIYKEGDIPEIKLTAPNIEMLFITVSDDEESVVGATVYFEYLDKKLECVSDNTGQIVLKNVPVNTDVKVYQLHNGKEVNIETNRCKKDKAQYFIIVDKSFDFSNMKFKLVDKSGQIIRVADVRFKVEDKEFEAVTNQDGYIIVENVKVGNIVECKQMIFGKSLPWHKFKCDANIDEYILHGERPQPFNQTAERYDSQVRMKFKLVDSKQQPIPNAVLRLEFGDKVRNRYTNQFGEAMIDDVLIGDKIKAFVDLRGAQVNAEFICQEDNEMHQIMLKSGSTKLLYWLIPLVIIIIAAIYFASSDKDENGSDKKEEEVVKEKDTLIINNYFFQVNEQKTSEPVSGSKVSLFYKDTVFEQFTDKEGLAKFAALKNNLPVKFEISKLGYLTKGKVYTLDSVFIVQISRNDSIGLAEDLLPCNTLIESGIYSTQYQSFKMNAQSGSFKIWANSFDISDKFEVYNGTMQSLNKQKLVYTTNGFIRGIINPTINFNSKDSIITVCVSSSPGKTSWVYKVYCVRKYVAPVP